MCHDRRDARRIGLSSIELIVVVSLLALLFSLLLPAVQNARQSAARTKCQNNLRQIGLALHGAHDRHGRLPPFGRFRIFGNDTDSALNWQALILPDIEQEPLWRTSEAACRADWNSTHNPPHVGYATVMPLYVCPLDARLLDALTTPTGDFAAFTSYIGVAGVHRLPNGWPLLFRGVLGDMPGIRLADIHDGTSNTLMVGERPPPDSLQAGRWYSGLVAIEPFGGPDKVLAVNKGVGSPFDLQCANANKTRYFYGRLDNPCDRFHFWSLHSGGGNFLFADGAVRFLPYSADAVLGALASRSGGEVVNSLD